jgi:glycosyltransferase involved in cell wall biosynthesis
VRILFACKQHFDVGGIERTTDQLARRLSRRGHDVAILAPPRFGGPSGGPPGLEHLQLEGYRAWVAVGVAPGPALVEVLERWPADVVVVNAGDRWFHDWTRALVHAARSRVPCVMYLHDAQAAELLAEPEIEPEFVWGCADTRSKQAREAGFDALTVPPLIEPDLYRTEPTGEVVLFVNPVKAKGVRIAITLAGCRRDIPFVFLRSWNVPQGYLGELQKMADTLGNIEIAAPVDDPREHYARARLLLAPYDDHSRPRVVTEAQMSGIPAMAYDDDGFREVVGSAGILVPREAGVNGWLHGLATLWDDREAHARYAAAARERGRQHEAELDQLLEAVEASLAEAVARFTKKSEAAPAREQARPLVSVILPVRQGAATIAEQLEALSRQSYSGEWELLVCDNGSTDGTRARVLAWEGVLPLRLVDASDRRGVAHARNVGIEEAKGDYIVICDADDVAHPDWLRSMVAALSRHPIVSGAQERGLLNPPELWGAAARSEELECDFDYLPFVAGGNLGMHREVAQKLVAFDETILRTEDMDWAWRAQYAGYHIHFAGNAVMHRREPSAPLTVISKWFRDGMDEALLYRRHRYYGLEPEDRSEVVAAWRWLATHAGEALRDPGSRQEWLSTFAQRSGRVAGSIRHGVRFF